MTILAKVLPLVADNAHPSQKGNDLIRDELLKVEG